MDSIWMNAWEPPGFPPMERSIRTDVLVIGGGIAGILTAFMLKRAGVRCVLVEADRICRGITKNTTAKITLQHGLIYDRMIRQVGIERARLYLLAQRAAMDEYRALCQGIACDYGERDAFVYSLDHRAKIEKEVAALRRLGCHATFEKDLPLPFPVAGAVRVTDQAEVHPLKFLSEIAKDLPIFEETKVLEFRPYGVTTNRGKIIAEKIIVTTHFPMLNKHGAYFLKMYQHRSYVIALEGAPDVKGMYVDESDTGLSFRNHNGLLLLGGGSHRTGKKGGSFTELSELARRYYPSARETARWATQDCMTLDGIPYIGQYSARTPNLYVATGFNKWGMTSAMVSAMLLTDLVTGKENELAAVFSPSRSILHKQLAINAGEAILGLLTPTARRCPHLGCALKYNPQEHSWDCSCHGSRFSEAGDVIDNPATEDLKK